MTYQDEDDDQTIYSVVVNHEEQYSIWPADRDPPLGWKTVGEPGLKSHCLEYIAEVWTDMRPLSLRKKMEEAARSSQVPAPEPTEGYHDTEPSIVDRLCEGDHPVVASIRPEATAGSLKERIDRGYVHIKFTNTRGGTELGVRLDIDACDLGQADFETPSGSVHLEGGLTVDFAKVRCVADIDLVELAGTGHLERQE